MKYQPKRLGARAKVAREHKRMLITDAIAVLVSIPTLYIMVVILTA